MNTSSVCVKSTMAWLMAFIMSYANLQGAEADEKAILDDWEQAINRSPDGFDPKYVSMLGQALRKLSRPRPTYREIRHRLFLEAQQKMLSIPGHAQYFADEIEKFRERVQRVPRANQTDYDFFRALSISETLIHMPSPETMTVLGNYLHDERDAKPERNWTPENAHLAAYALSRIGLRDFPFEGAPVANSLSIWPDLKQLPDYRAWWEELKSGQRTFSFKGQAVEYRFRPDGTWDTIPIANPPDDGSKPTSKTMRDSPVKKTKSSQVDSDETSHGSWWWWFGIGGVALLTAAAWLWRKKG
jgi:hypothetical protein